MTRVVTFSENNYQGLRRFLLRSTEQEEAAFLIAGASRSRETLNLLVRDVITVPLDGFLERDSLALTIAPVFINRILKRCRLDGTSAVLCHSHPFWEEANYSPVDDFGESRVFECFASRVPGVPHASMLFGQTAVTGRVWLDGKFQPLDEVAVVGRRVERIDLRGGAKAEVSPEDVYDRQVRLFGQESQQALMRFHASVVGAGGTGSAVFEQLIRIGVGQVTVIDDDSVERSNLTRILGSTREDVSKSKVDVLERWARKVSPQTTVRAVHGNIFDDQVALYLRDSDFIFCCTDNHWSRAIINQVAYQYLIPTIDMGIQFVVEGGKVIHGSGKVVRLGPEFPCLWCYGDISSERIAEENLPQAEREKLRGEGYVRGMDAPSPSVISFNMQVASAAVSEFLKAVTGFADKEGVVSRLNFDFLTGSVRRATVEPRPDCVCAPGRFKALGDLEKLPVRRKDVR